MPTTRTLTATLPDGRIVTRRTARDYTSVVCWKRNGKWSAVQWTTRNPETIIAGFRRDEQRWQRQDGGPASEYASVPVNS